MRALLLRTQDGDWEALYIDKELISQAHTVGEGERHFIWRKCHEAGITPDDLVEKELDDEDEDYAMMCGNMPENIDKYWKK
jgi:hypothetical protein